MDRPEFLHGKTIKLSTPCGSFFLTTNEHEGKLYEVRMLIGKSGNCVRGLFEGMAILISLLLQSGMDKEEIAKALEKQMESNCGNKIWHHGEIYTSCLDFAIKHITEEMLAREELEVN